MGKGVGATGNVGTSVLRSLENEESVQSVLGLARRLPGLRMNKVEWAAVDIARDDLVPHFRGADAVILLAWLIQPSRDLNKLWVVNVEGSTRAARAVACPDSSLRLRRQGYILLGPIAWHLPERGDRPAAGVGGIS